MITFSHTGFAWFVLAYGFFMLLAGVGAWHLAQTIGQTNAALRIPDPPIVACGCPPPGPPVVIQAPAANPEPAPRHPGMPEPTPMADAFVFDDLVHDMFAPTELDFKPWHLETPSYRGQFDTWHGEKTGAYPVAELLARADDHDDSSTALTVSDVDSDDPVLAARHRFTKHKPSKQLAGAR